MTILTDIQLDTALQKLTKAEEKLYLLLEGAGKDAPAREWLLAHNNEQLFIPLYIDTDYEPCLGASPLLAIVERDAAFLRWYVENGPKARGILLASRHGLEKVLQHLRGMIEVRLPDYNYAAFRYHDPIIIERYVNSIGPEAIERFLGPLAVMAWPKLMHAKNSPDQWTWRALIASENLSDEENPYLHPQPIIDLTNEQLDACEQAYYTEIVARLHARF